MRQRETAVLLFCFLVSGATSLTLEVTWSKELSYILGNTLYAVSSVVAAFMLGLGIGSAVAGQVGETIRRPLRAYAMLQIGVAVCGILSIPALRHMRPIFATVYASSSPSFLLVRFVVVFSLMLVPAMLMGMTLPVVTGAMGRTKERYDSEAGLAYGWNTLGAVLGTLGGGFVLIPQLGLLRTCLVAATADLAIATVALLLDRKIGPISDIRYRDGTEGEPASAWNGRQWSIAILFGVSGAVALGLEVGWFRLLGLAVGPSVYAFAAMLGMYLTGIGFGSALGSWWVARTRTRGLPAMAALEALLGGIGLLSLHYMNQLPTVSFNVLQATIGKFGDRGLALGQLSIAAAVVLAPCLVMGFLFPVTVRALLESGEEGTPERAVGRLYMLNTAGGIVGSLAAGFWLVPRFGIWPTLIAAGLCSGGLAAVLLLLDNRTGAARRMAWAAGAILMTASLASLAPAWNVKLFNQGLYREGYKGLRLPADRLAGETLIFYHEGINAPVAVMKFSEGATLLVSGKADASTHIEDLDTQLFLGHLPVLFTRDPRRAAVIGYGSGVTAHAFLTHPEVLSLDILEIESGVIEASPFFESMNANPLQDPRTHLIVEDGRTHLTYSESIYDCISSEPSNPWMAGVANLFTSDFYRLVRSRLSEDGVFAQWIQDYEISEGTYRVLLASLHDVFPYLVVFHPTTADSIVLASGKPISVPWDVFRDRFSSPLVQESLYGTTWKNPCQILFTLQCPAESVERFLETEGRRNTDDNVWLERRMPFEMVETREPGKAGQALVRLGATRRVAALRAMLPGIPLEQCLREMILYPHSLEPQLTFDAVLTDSWHKFRGTLLDGLRQELDAMQETQLSARAAEWDEEGMTYAKNRDAAAVMLQPIAFRRKPAAGEKIEQALSRAPDLPVGLLMAGEMLEGAGKFDAAEGFYRQAAASPQSRMYHRALLGLSRTAHAQGRIDDAIALAEAAVKQNPYVPGAHLLLATLQIEKGDAKAARTCLENGLKLNPDAKNIQQKLGQITPSGHAS